MIQIKNSRLLRWQALMMVLMVVGYSGYYLCRSNFSVCLPSIRDELAGPEIKSARLQVLAALAVTAPATLDSASLSMRLLTMQEIENALALSRKRDQAKEQLGTVVFFGGLAYALGKFISGGIGDFLGGRRNFLAGMTGSILFTILFALGGTIPWFTFAWIANRLVQSLGWVGMVKISSRWYSFSTYGTVMGLISLSFFFGDAVSRLFMKILLDAEIGWHHIFYIAAGVLAVILLLNFFLLKETPRLIGEAEPHSNPLNVFGKEGEEARPPGLLDLLKPLLASWAFWLVCFLSLGMTLLRETMNTWTPTYFTEIGLSKPAAAGYSALVPFFGGISGILAGLLSDWLGRGGRATIIFFGMALVALGFMILGYVNFAGSTVGPVALMAFIAFMLLGPYSYLAGAISLDFGGKQGSATACGIIDGVGYLGGALAGYIANISVHYGWGGAFTLLAGVAGASSLGAVLYWVNQRRPAFSTKEIP
jgi:sugar phosphate permease